MRNIINWMEISHAELTVVRPNGTTEIIKLTDKRKNMNDKIFAQIVKGTKDAGKGDVTGYKIIRVERSREMTKDEIELDSYCRNHEAVKKAMSY